MIREEMDNALHLKRFTHNIGLGLGSNIFHIVTIYVNMRQLH